VIMELKKTPLFKEHKKLKASLSEFSGFLMPIQYESIVKEHLWCRKHCAVFDTCHMGQFRVEGKTSAEEFNPLVTADVLSIDEGRCRYSFLLNENGGIIDDLVIYRISDTSLMLVVNAGTKDKDEMHIRTYLNKSSFEDLNPLFGKVDVQGPESRVVLEDLFSLDLSGLKFYRFDYFDFFRGKYLISRTGYTGELGYEIYMETGKLSELWNKLLSDERVKPAGLGARDTLRLESGLPLYGQDMDEEITPFEAGLGKFVNLDKDFLGKQALTERKEKDDKILVYFISETRKAPRHNYSIFSDEGKEIGKVTSGTFSPTLEKGIGSGYIKLDYSGEGTNLIIRNNGNSFPVRVIKKPFFKGSVMGASL